MPVDESAPSAGRPFPEVFPAGRDLEPTPADRAAGRRQRELLGPDVPASEWQIQQIEALQTRHPKSLSTTGVTGWMTPSGCPFRGSTAPKKWC